MTASAYMFFPLSPPPQIRGIAKRNQRFGELNRFTFIAKCIGNVAERHIEIASIDNFEIRSESVGHIERFDRHVSDIAAECVHPWRPFSFFLFLSLSLV